MNISPYDCKENVSLYRQFLTFFFKLFANVCFGISFRFASTVPAAFVFIGHRWSELVDDLSTYTVYSLFLLDHRLYLQHWMSCYVLDKWGEHQHVLPVFFFFSFLFNIYGGFPSISTKSICIPKIHRWTHRL